MGRVKVPMELINNEKKRKLAFKSRKEGALKKAHELATLCDVNVSMIISSDYQETPEIFPQDPRLLNDMINLYKRGRANGKIRSFGLSDFCKDGKDTIEGELAKTTKKKENLEGKDKYSVGELRVLSSRLESKINQVKARIEFLMSKKSSKFENLDGRDSLKMPLNKPNPLTISFGSDHGVESCESSNATAANRCKPVMLMGQNLLGHDSDSMVSTFTKDDNKSVSDGAIQPEVLQQLEQPQCLDLLSCFRT